jgi:hypothetical protein
VSISLSSRLVRRDHCLGSRVGEEEVLLDVDRSVYVGFDVIGSRIWRRLAEPVIVSDLVSELVEAYDGPAETIQADVLALVHDLAAQGLVEAIAE